MSCRSWRTSLYRWSSHHQIVSDFSFRSLCSVHDLPACSLVAANRAEGYQGHTLDTPFTAVQQKLVATIVHNAGI
jgi:hypothetical protein